MQVSQVSQVLHEQLDDLQVNLHELVAAHLVYMNLNFHGHSLDIQCDISILLKGIENRKSRVVATLLA